VMPSLERALSLFLDSRRWEREAESPLAHDARADVALSR
jgi:hypothetical protein